MTIQNTRRYDLDWIRVLAFGLLIFYHIGMYFNSEGWHAKSPHMNDTIDHFMWLSSPFRLSLLFLISGIALRFAVDKGSSLLAFTWKRFNRLMIPVLFGMIVIVTPQAYYELLGKGEIEAGYWAFYARYLGADDTFSITVPTWNHLWYVVYLLIYSLIAIPMMPLLRKMADLMDRPWFARFMGTGRLFLIPSAIFILYRFTTQIWYPNETHALVSDWDAHARYGTYFLIGLLIAKNATFWKILASTWRVAAVGAFSLAVSLSLLWANLDAWFGGITAIENIVRAMRPLYAWVIIMAILGAGQAYLNKPSKRLTYLTEAVFPYYIVHQTLIIIIGVQVSALGLSVWPEFILILAGTIVGCTVLHEYVIRRTPILRPLFGLPFSKDKAIKAKPVSFAAE